MEETWKTLIQVAPWGFVIIALRWLDIQEKREERKDREANAKDKGEQDRQTQVIVGKAYADAINNIASVVGDMKMTMIEQYKNIGITQDLIDIAKETMRGGQEKRK